jgi:group I intron endonuclease
MRAPHKNASLIDPAIRNAPGIYAITNRTTGRVYVGSSVRVRSRLTTHLWHLRQGRHGNAHLQASWDKHGEAAFICSVLSECAEHELLVMEKQAIADAGVVYNQRVEPHSNRGLAHTAETKATIGIAASLAWNRPEYREAVLGPRMGIPLSVEHRRKIAGTKRGIPLSDTTRQRMREAPRKLSPRTAEHNANLGMSRAKAYRVTDPTGISFIVLNLRAFCRARGLQQSHMSKVARGLQSSHKGWLCQFA